MYARRLAMCCLLYVSIMSGRSQTGPGKGVVVYMNTGDSLSATVLAEAKTEIVYLMGGLGIHVEWWDADRSQADTVGSVATLIVADFRGTCSVPSHERPRYERNVADVRSLAPLAATSISDGHILPFAHVDCGALGDFVGPILTDQPSARREHLLGRAVGRLLAHEIYHILAQTKDHTTAGIAKEHFSTTDLLAERFEFEPAAVAKLQETPLAPPHARTPTRFE